MRSTKMQYKVHHSSACHRAAFFAVESGYAKAVSCFVRHLQWACQNQEDEMVGIILPAYLPYRLHVQVGETPVLQVESGGQRCMPSPNGELSFLFCAASLPQKPFLFRASIWVARSMPRMEDSWQDSGSRLATCVVGMEVGEDKYHEGLRRCCWSFEHDYISNLL